MASAGEVMEKSVNAGADDPIAATLDEPRLARAASGGELMAELLGVFDELSERMGEGLATSSSSRMLFRALKLALPALGQRGQALAVATSLAELQVVPPPLAPPLRSCPVLWLTPSEFFRCATVQMDAEVISAGILREALDAGAVSMLDVETRIGARARPNCCARAYGSSMLPQRSTYWTTNARARCGSSSSRATTSGR
jgi:hypothetical protein